MLNNEMYEEIRSKIEKKAEKELAIARSWKNVGKNYATKKDGKPFADPLKAFQGVDGIKEVRKDYRDIVNSEGFSVKVDRSDTVADVEEKIEREIYWAEKEYRSQQFLLSHLDTVFAQCDKTIDTLSAYFTDYEKTADGLKNDHLVDLTYMGTFNDLADSVSKYVEYTLREACYQFSHQREEQRESKEEHARREQWEERGANTGLSSRSSLASLIEDAEAESQEAPEAAETSRDDMER